MYDIEKDVPIPLSRWGRLHRKYPSETMSVGDSYLAPIKEKASVRCHLSFLSKKTGYKFVTRQEDNKESIRIWRVA